MLDIARTLHQWCEEGRDFAVATVASVSGSAPRDIGAALAVDADGEVTGNVSGGCVEGAVYDLCREALRGDGRPVVEHFGYSDEDAFAVGLTCGGELTALVVPVRVQDPCRAAVAAAVAAAAAGEAVAAVRVVEGEPAAPAGALAVRPDGTVHGTLGAWRRLDTAAASEARALLAAGRTGRVTLRPDDTCGPDPLPEDGGPLPEDGGPLREDGGRPLGPDDRRGAGPHGPASARWGRSLTDPAPERARGGPAPDGSASGGPAPAGPVPGGFAPGGPGALRGPDGSAVTLLVESSLPPPRMLVFGAIDFAAALVRAGVFLGHRVTVCDARPVFTTPSRFPGADEVVTRWPHRYLDEQAAAGALDSRTVLCVLTHDLRFDIPLLERALRLPVAYVGAMGSRRTHRDRLARLVEAGLSDRELARLHSPIGLDLGARTPEETALSIAAEIVAVRHGGTGRPLTGGSTPIHREAVPGERPHGVRVPEAERPPRVPGPEAERPHGRTGLEGRRA